jgi:hypothetical protein
LGSGTNGTKNRLKVTRVLRSQFPLRRFHVPRQRRLTHCGRTDRDGRMPPCIVVREVGGARLNCDHFSGTPESVLRLAEQWLWYPAGQEQAQARTTSSVLNYCTALRLLAASRCFWLEILCKFLPVHFHAISASTLRGMRNGRSHQSRVLRNRALLCASPAPLSAQIDNATASQSVKPSQSIEESRTESEPCSTFDFEEVVRQPAGPAPTPRDTGIKAMLKDLVADVKHLPSKENFSGREAAEDWRLRYTRRTTI